MASIRTEKIANLIREILSSALLLEIKDPAIRDLSITDVEVSGDLSSAKIYFYSHDQSENHIKKLKAGLERAKGFLRRKLAQELTIRVTPNLQFFVDNTLEKAASIEKILQQALAEDEAMRLARGGKDAVDQENQNMYKEPKHKSTLLDDDSSFDESDDDSSFDGSDDDSSFDGSDDDSSFDGSDDDDSSFDGSDDDSSFDESDDDM